MKTLTLLEEFYIIVPDNWELVDDKEIIAIYDSYNGLGALQFSFYQIPNQNKVSLTNELEDFLFDKYENMKVIIVDNNAYFDIEDEEGIYWRYWLQEVFQKLIFISYNCEKSNRGKEDEVVNAIIKSLKSRMPII